MSEIPIALRIGFAAQSVKRPDFDSYFGNQPKQGFGSRLFKTLLLGSSRMQVRLSKDRWIEAVLLLPTTVTLGPALPFGIVLTTLALGAGLAVGLVRGASAFA